MIKVTLIEENELTSFEIIQDELVGSIETKHYSEEEFEMEIKPKGYEDKESPISVFQVDRLSWSINSRYLTVYVKHSDSVQLDIKAIDEIKVGYDIIIIQLK